MTTTEDGEWIMNCLSSRDTSRLRTWKELVKKVNDMGFLPLFSNEVEGFSVEEMTGARYWWTGDRENDPWEWREVVAASHKCAYGKFFGNRAGFISLKWLPAFVNARRLGYDFDARYQDGLASRREKKIMDFFLTEDEDGDVVFKDEKILSTELKKSAGFGKGGEKNFPGIVTGLQMQTYLVISGFERRKNKKGEEFGMPVSILLPPEAIWGNDKVTASYNEKPEESWEKILKHVRKMYPEADEEDITKVIGKRP